MRQPPEWKPRPWPDAIPLYVTPRNSDRDTIGPELEAVALRLGFRAMPWQREHWATYGELDERGRLFYSDGTLTVPRQTAKTSSTLVRHVHRQTKGEARGWGERPVSAFTMQHASDARSKMVEEWMPTLERSSYFVPSGKANKGDPDSEIAQFLKTNGLEAIKWRDGGRIITFPPNATGAHGGTLDAVDIDEAFAFPDDRAEQGSFPATITRPSPQTTKQSTAGTLDSVYLKGLVETGRARTLAGDYGHAYYLEYAANPDAGDDIHNPEHWWRWMPALGYTIALDRLIIVHDNYMASTDPDKGEAGWARAFCNLWTSVAARIIPAREWAACAVPKTDQIKERSRLYLAADSSPSLTGNRWSAITLSGYREDGRVQTEVLEHAAGLDWLVEAIAALTRKWPIVSLRVDPKSPIAAVLPDIRRRANAAIVETDTETMAAACSRYHEDVIRTARALEVQAKAIAAGEDVEPLKGGLAHLADPALDAAADGAAKRTLLDGFAFARRTSTADICPLVSAAQSHWEAATHPDVGVVRMAT